MIRLRILWNEAFKPNNRHSIGPIVFGFGDQDCAKMTDKSRIQSKSSGKVFLESPYFSPEKTP